MVKNLLTVLNCLLIFAGALGVGFVSLISLLSKEQHKEFVKEPIKAFLIRFTIAGVVGLLGTCAILLFNFITNYLFLDNHQKINLKKLFVLCIIITIVISGAGSLIFVID
jgi:uncharacterized BrkB/YihY/UPF0761 family membrane protein